VIDPTKNVLDNIEATTRRLDDLRIAEAELRRAETRRIDDLRMAEARRLSDLRQADAELRRAESQRIDAIRAVDVGAVNRAAEVSATQAATLAAQVANSAEALRTQVAAAATAATTNLSTALEPIQKDIADLRRAQYEAQGVKAQTGETRLNVGAILGGLSVMLVLIFGVATILIALLARG
jgi:hypothetical protein